MQGRRQEFGLGPYPVVTLAMAREAAIQHRRDVRAGENPKTRRLRERGVPTFAEAACKVYELRRPGWRNAKHAHQWIATLEEFVFSRIGARTVDDVTADDVLGTLSPSELGAKVGDVALRRQIIPLGADSIAHHRYPDFANSVDLEMITH